MKFLIFLFALPYFAFAECSLNELSFNELKQLPRFEAKKEEEIPYENLLFEQFKSELGEFESLNCEPLMKKTFYDRITKNKLTVIHTFEEECDGGNTYGLILEGDFVVATIQDSEIFCLKK